MKRLAFLLLLCPFLSFAQKKKDLTPFDYRMQGWSAGARIDTISAPYAQAEFNTAGMVSSGLVKRFTFDWGQPEEAKKLVDEKGEVITFPSTAAALNFFYHNGWEFVQPTQNGLLLRRR